ncbi:restriction endonuclease subunit S [Olleya sp. Hel_I_94]|uniref:restriction endonuclease subunit S n=1 Tax=Olleya sp. Hel_I_94 TaxID=1250001 RepID=UPI0011A1B0BF|nr:restriction endonuclease subunit S [Olleya sp. Hel_I_94]TVZ46151.1 type I restriction enzyme S subunit [Olleya sp. Hel_I_94]
MHNNWKTYKLSDTLKIIGGGTPKTSVSEYWNGDIPWLSVKDFQGEQKFVSSTEKTITEEGLKKSSTKLLPKGAIIISARGTVGELAVLEKEMTFNQSCYGLLPNEKTDKNYLYYLVKQKIRELQGLSYGSVFDTITTKTFDGLDVQLPPLPEQTEIANILSAIDDKIENNLAINKTLEDMAMALYKHWFVDFGPFQDGEFIDSDLGLIPEGWEVKRLEELSEIGSSKRIFRKEYVDVGVPFYRGKEVIQLSKGKNISTELFITEERFQEIKLKFGAPVKGDILISSVGTIGVSWLVDDSDEFYFKDGNLTWLKNYKSFIKGEFLHLWLNSNVGQEQILGETIGSTQQALTISALRSLKLVIPPKSIYQKLEENLVNSYRQTQLNLSEVATLTNLRDTLLPKLISGEVRLKEFREQVENLV